MRDWKSILPPGCNWERVVDVEEHLDTRYASSWDAQQVYQEDIEFLLSLVEELGNRIDNLSSMNNLDYESKRALQAVAEIQRTLNKHDFCCLSMALPADND
jgi:hypothetical protein